MKIANYLMVLIASLFIGSTASYAQEAQSEQQLDGTSLVYYYDSGAGLDMSFDDGKVNYEWIAGPAKGRTGEDFAYRAKMAGDDVYVVSIHQEKVPNYLTLIFNFKEKVVCGSNLLWYGTDKQKVHFESGTIKQIKR
jgi:hypothetical protein